MIQAIRSKTTGGDVARKTRFVAMMAVLLVPCLALAEDKYEIKVRKKAKGDVELVSQDETLNQHITVKAGGVVVQDAKENSQQLAKYKLDVLEIDEKHNSVKERREYEKATVTVKGSTTDTAYVGKTVLIEKLAKPEGKKKYRFSFEGGKELTSEQSGPLQNEFNKESKDSDEDMEKYFLPKKAVALNETWPVDVKGMFTNKKEQELDLDFDKAKATGKLTKAYKKGNVQYGVLEISIDAPLKAVNNPGEKMVFNPGATVSIIVTLDGCIDAQESFGKVSMTMKMKGESSIKMGNQTFDIVLDVEAVQKTEHSPAKK